MFDSKKKLKIATGESVCKKLAGFQLNCIEFNSCLLSFYTNQIDQFKKKSLQLSESGKLIKKYNNQVKTTRIF